MWFWAKNLELCHYFERFSDHENATNIRTRLLAVTVKLLCLNKMGNSNLSAGKRLKWMIPWVSLLKNNNKVSFTEDKSHT